MILKMRRMGHGRRLHVETGIEIHSDGRDGFVVCSPGAGQPAPVNYGSLALARDVAVIEIAIMRGLIAAAYVEAYKDDTARTDALIAVIVTEVAEIRAARPEGAIVNTLLFGAKASAQGGFLDVARRRLDRAKAILSGAEQVPAEADVEQARAQARMDFPIGTRVLLADDTRATIDALPNIEAETGRIFVGVRVGRAYFLRYVETLRKA